MDRIHQAMLLACAILVVALLAVLGFVPEAVARYAPLAVVPFIVAGKDSCRIAGRREAA